MKRSTWWIFGAYCMLASSEWLIAPLSTQVRGITFAALGIAAAAYHGRKHWNEWREVGRLALAAVLLVAAPEVLSRWAVRHVAGAMSTAVMSLVPVILVLILAQHEGEMRHLLAPAVVGLGGILLLIPLSISESLVGRLAVVVLLIAAVLMAVASARIHRLLQAFDWSQAMAIFCLANSASLLTAGPFFGGSSWSAVGAWSSIALTAVEVLLFVPLLKQITPARFGARFLLIPLLTIAEGVILLRPELTSRMAVGAVLLAGGALFLLLSGETDEKISLSLR